MLLLIKKHELQKSNNNLTILVMTVKPFGYAQNIKKKKVVQKFFEFHLLYWSVKIMTINEFLTWAINYI